MTKEKGLILCHLKYLRRIIYIIVIDQIHFFYIYKIMNKIMLIKRGFFKCILLFIYLFIYFVFHPIQSLPSHLLS